jgi:uncharacterized membrane protein (UPF0127 family)
MKKCILRINDTVIGDNIGIADNFFTRFRGLMLKKSLPENTGLMIYPCNSIHMFFMYFPLDILFVDKNDNIVDYLENFEINKVSKIYSKARYVVELPAGTIKSKNIQKNQKILITPLDKLDN